MAETDRIVVDTSAFYAIAVDTDLFHPQARAFYAGLSDTRQEIWTTSYALVETIALLERRVGFGAVRDFSQWVDANEVQVLWIDAPLHDEILRRYLAQPNSQLNFVDWTTAAAIHLDAAIFTFDQAFAHVGLTIAPS